MWLLLSEVGDGAGGPAGKQDCAVLAWSRIRSVRLADGNLKASDYRPDPWSWVTRGVHRRKPPADDLQVVAVVQPASVLHPVGTGTWHGHLEGARSRR